MKIIVKQKSPNNTREWLNHR